MFWARNHIVQMCWSKIRYFSNVMGRNLILLKCLRQSIDTYWRFQPKSNTFRFFRQKYTFFLNVLNTNSIFFGVFFNYNYFRMVYTNSILFELNQNQIIFLIRIENRPPGCSEMTRSGARGLRSEQKAYTGGLGSEMGFGV